MKVSTNVAESSITVPDVVYIIDFCLSKEIVYNSFTGYEKYLFLNNIYVSCSILMIIYIVKYEIIYFF
jgi:ATP-dependent RNA helicase TDRD9